MEIKKIFSVLVPPGKNRDNINLLGTEIQLEGELYNLIKKVYDKSEKECDIPIYFESENQQNTCRKMMIDCLKTKSIDEIKSFFLKLSKVTTSVPGIALCFFIIGKKGNQTTIFICRFPAAEAIRTNLDENNFKVDVVKDIYLRSSKFYKSVLYQDESIKNGFWKGKAIDKQTNHKDREISEYWIKDFLKSDFEVTSKSGTATLALSLKDAIQKEEELDNKQQLISFSNMLMNHDSQNITINEQCNNFGMSEELKEKIKSNLKCKAFFDSRFTFDKEEFISQAVFRTVYMKNGAILSAESTKFDSCFQAEVLNAAENMVKYTTISNIEDIKVRKRV